MFTLCLKVYAGLQCYDERPLFPAGPAPLSAVCYLSSCEGSAMLLFLRFSEKLLEGDSINPGNTKTAQFVYRRPGRRCVMCDVDLKVESGSVRFFLKIVLYKNLPEEASVIVPFISHICPCLLSEVQRCFIGGSCGPAGSQFVSLHMLHRTAAVSPERTLCVVYRNFKYLLSELKVHI